MEVIALYQHVILSHIESNQRLRVCDIGKHQIIVR